MTDREKLAGLLIDARETADMKCIESGCTGYCVLDSSACDLCFAGLKADHLLANGVAFAENATVESKWIPVSERLPRSRESVLIYSSDGGSAEGCYNESTKTWKQYRWRAEGLPVTHWMPLPEPPKGE